MRQWTGQCKHYGISTHSTCLAAPQGKTGQGAASVTAYSLYDREDALRKKEINMLICILLHVAVYSMCIVCYVSRTRTIKYQLDLFLKWKIC